VRLSMFIVAASLLIAAGTASAVEPHSCRNDSFPSSVNKISAGRIVETAAARVHFRNDDDGCPEAASCVQKAYLVPGDRVLVAQRDGAWVCVWYFAKRQKYVGWMPANAVAREAARTPTLDEWVGTWRPIFGENEIVIRRDSAAKGLYAEGTATWYGVEFADGTRNIHVGDFSDRAVPKGDRWTVGVPASEDDCGLQMRLVAGQLVVHDNMRCGGLNVRFDDIYRKAGAAPATQANGR